MRNCGSCTLCCKLLPVKALDKGAGERCRHQRAFHCSVYGRHNRGFPVECKLWSCQWLTSPTTSKLKRPDRTHYVVDLIPDMIRVTNNATGEANEMVVTQVWLDPAFPDAWRDDDLLEFIEASGRPAMIRLNRTEGFAVFPPSVTGEQKFIISGSAESVPTITGSRLLDQLTAEMSHG
jgi:hypothetical protein